MFGALFICVDIIVRLFPGKRDFRIQDSDGFLGCSLSLSAGVMLFSALYKMLPSSKRSLEAGGSSSQEASWILILAFLGGVFGIQIFQRIIHRFMPSHAVDCDHDHGVGEGGKEEMKDGPDHSYDGSRHAHQHRYGNGIAKVDSRHSSDSEETPLLSRTESHPAMRAPEVRERQKSLIAADGTLERPTLQSRVTATMANIVKNKSECDVNGPCYGFTNPCGHDCFKKVSMRGGVRQWFATQKPGLQRAASTTVTRMDGANETTKRVRLEDHADRAPQTAPLLSPLEERSLHSQELHPEPTTDQSTHHTDEEEQSSSQHHHHIPTNAFLSISVQTSIAIALHKLPEGFITYATNHANPKLGVAVFIAIGIHNITEGFALALPIYLASGSRIKALLLSVLLGGLSQPVGAGVAAAWLKIAERGRGSDAGSDISDSGYGSMFAITAGIMASVALSLLQESFELSHNKSLCMVFTFIGMGVLGISTALNA